MKIAIPLLLLLSIVGLTPAQSEKPNILWIISDDLGPELACYGDQTVRTPHLDQLAAEGMRFDRAYSTSPVCSASRSAIITGMYQTSIGAHHHRTMKREPLPDGVRTVAQRLQESAGYQTFNIKGMGANGKLDFNFEFDEKTWLPTAKPATLTKNQPFFAQVNFFEPHRTFADVEDGIDPAKVVLPPYYPDHPLVREDWAAYLDSVEIADQKTGDLLQWLEAEGLAENTLVFFFGDHGRPHVRGKQWLYEGGIRVPLLVRWPDKVPAGSVSRELTSLIDVAATTLHVAGVPLPPTLEGRPFLGPEPAEPRSYAFAARDRCGDAADRIRCVVSERYKYIRNFYPQLPYYNTSRYKSVQYPVLALMKQMWTVKELTPAQARFFAPSRPAEEFYDLQADPHEIHNLAEDPAFAEALQVHREALETWIAETGDQGAIPEPDELRRAAEESSRRAFEKRGFTPDPWDDRVTEIWRRMGWEKAP